MFGIVILFSTAFKIEIILSWLLVLQLAIYMCFSLRVRQILGDKIESAPLSVFLEYLCHLYNKIKYF